MAAHLTSCNVPACQTLIMASPPAEKMKSRLASRVCTALQWLSASLVSAWADVSGCCAPAAFVAPMGSSSARVQDQALTLASCTAAEGLGC